MAQKPQKIKVIEVTGVKLNPKAKYIFCLDPAYADRLVLLSDELERLIGGDKFTIGLLPTDALKVFEIVK